MRDLVGAPWLSGEQSGSKISEESKLGTAKIGNPGGKPYSCPTGPFIPFSLEQHMVQLIKAGRLLDFPLAIEHGSQPSRVEALLKRRSDPPGAGLITGSNFTCGPALWNSPASSPSSGLALWACLFKCSSSALRFARSSVITCSHLLRPFPAFPPSPLTPLTRLSALPR